METMEVLDAPTQLHSFPESVLVNLGRDGESSIQETCLLLARPRLAASNELCSSAKIQKHKVHLCTVPTVPATPIHHGELLNAPPPLYRLSPGRADAGCGPEASW
jgi:hypothetical protein